ncbi:MAG: hypothetical protein CM15mP119_1580 [Alphaproteobacteria bacterium]|nr:MAG: hypothetical protein CM15mP119_1580 [Alphaproteobacteria bacterium]
MQVTLPKMPPKIRRDRNFARAIRFLLASVRGLFLLCFRLQPFTLLPFTAGQIGQSGQA